MTYTGYISIQESVNIVNNYMIIDYLNCLLKAATSLRVSSGGQWQAAVNFNVSPKSTWSDLTFYRPTTLSI